jgi:hypothetical protein
VSLDWRLTAVRRSRARRSVHSGSQLGNCVPVALSWKRAELGPGGLARAVDRSRPRPCLELRQRPQIRWRWRHECLLQLAGYPKIPRAETAPGWTTWELCRSRGQTRRSGRSTPVVTRRHDDQSAFSTLPGEHPIGSLRWPLGSSRYATTESSSVCRLTNEAPAPPKRPGFSRIRRSDSPAPKGGWPASGPGASATGTWQARFRRCPPKWACPPRWARINAVSGLTGRMSVQLACL